MVQCNFYLRSPLKSTWFSVLLSNPLTNDEFRFAEIVFGSVVVSLRNGAASGAKVFHQLALVPLAVSGR
jgi:hypothetical protein